MDDDALLGAFASNQPSIEVLLNRFFGWLRKKTDFFHLQDEAEGFSKGFPPGKAQELLNEAFEAQQALYPQMRKEKSSKMKGRNREKKAAPPADFCVVYSSKIPNFTEKSENREGRHSDECQRIMEFFDAVMGCQIGSYCVSVHWPHQENDRGIYLVLNSEEAVHSLYTGISHEQNHEEARNQRNLWRFMDFSELHLIQLKQFKRSKAIDSEFQALNDKKILSEKLPESLELEKPAEPTKQRVEGHISTWNGDIKEGFRWNQTIHDATVEVELPSKCRGRDVKVDFLTKNMKIVCKGTKLLEREFFAAVNQQDCMWSIEDEVRIIISLEKQKDLWWPQLFVGDEEIDVKKIESVKQIHEYDDSTQQHIRKLVTDYMAKNDGKATTEENAQLKALEQAWNSENSPFKETPFDFSMIRNTFSQ